MKNKILSLFFLVGLIMSCNNSDVIQVNQAQILQHSDRFTFSCELLNNSDNDNLYFINIDKPFVEIIRKKLYIYFFLFHDPVPFRETPYRTKTKILKPKQKEHFVFEFMPSVGYLSTDFSSRTMFSPDIQIEKDFIVQFGYLTGDIIFLNKPNFISEGDVVKFYRNGTLVDYTPDKLDDYSGKDYVTALDAQQSLQVIGKFMAQIK